MKTNYSIDDLTVLANQAQTEINRRRTHELDTTTAEKQLAGILYELAELAPISILRDVRASLAESARLTATNWRCLDDECQYCDTEEAFSQRYWANKTDSSPVTVRTIA